MRKKSLWSDVMFALPKREWTNLVQTINVLPEDPDEQAVIMFCQCEWTVLAWYGLSHKDSASLLKLIRSYCSSGKPHEFIRLGDDFLDPVEASSDTGSFSLIAVNRRLEAFVDFETEVETNDGEHN